MTNLPICIIPARGGSTRIPRKNIKLFHGKPIIQYSIENAFASGLFGKVIVSSDDDEILTIAKDCGALINRRPDSLAQNEIGTQEVARHVAIIHSRITIFPQVCVLYATAPLLDITDLHAGLAYLKGDGFDFVYPVDCQGHDAGQFYWCQTASLIQGKELDVAPTGHLVIPDSRVCDINTFDDWQRAEQMYAALNPPFAPVSIVGCEACGRSATELEECTDERCMMLCDIRKASNEH